MLATLLFRTALAIVLLCGASHAFTITVGVGLTIPGKFSHHATATKHVCMMWREHVRNYGIGDTGITDIDFDFRNVATSAANVSATYRAMAEDGIRLFVAPYSSGLTDDAALVVEEFGGVIVAGGAAAETVYQCFDDSTAGCRKAGTRRFKSLFGLFSPGGQYMRPFVSLMKIKQASSVALFRESNPFAASVCQGARDAAREQAMTVGLDTEIPRLSHSEEDAEAETKIMKDLLVKLKDLNPDAVVGCIYTDTCIKLLTMAEEMNYIPRGIALSTCIGSPKFETAVGDKNRYVMGSTQWHPSLEGNDFTEDATHPVGMFQATANMTSPQVFNKAFVDGFGSVAGYGSNPTYQAATSMASLYFLHMGISGSNSTEPMAVRDMMDRTFEPSFFGTLAAGRFGSNTAKPMATLQYSMDRSLEIVTPLTASTADAVYPIPKWEERTFVLEYYETWGEKLILALTILSIIYCVSVVMAVFYHRKTRVFKAASASFCMFALTGILICQFSVLSFPLHVTVASCVARGLALPLGMVVLCSSLIVKMYRIHAIFNSSKLSVRSYKDKTMLKWTAMLIAPAIILAIVHSTAEPYTHTLMEPDILRPSLSYYYCQSGGQVTMALLSAYIGLQVLVLLYLSVATRNVRSEFNEAKRVANAFFLLFFIGIVVVALRTSIADQRWVLYMLSNVSTLVVLAVVLSILFVPPLISIWFPSKLGIPGSNTTSRYMVGSQASSSVAPSSIGAQAVSEKLKKVYNVDFQTFKDNVMIADGDWGNLRAVHRHIGQAIHEQSNRSAGLSAAAAGTSKEPVVIVQANN